jgi:hypothetical protein
MYLQSTRRRLPTPYLCVPVCSPRTAGLSAERVDMTTGHAVRKEELLATQAA